MLVTYAVGKFMNGILADHSNIRSFMSAGLLASGLVNLDMGSTSSFIFGEGFTFVVTASIVSAVGWRWGFIGLGFLCASAAPALLRTLFQRLLYIPA